TLPGLITAVAGLIGAVAGLLQVPSILQRLSPSDPSSQVNRADATPDVLGDTRNRKNKNSSKPSNPTSPGQVFFGKVTDPEGDAQTFRDVVIAPDLVEATVEVNESFLVLRVRFASGTLDAHTTYVTFSIDTDENPLTGSPGVDAGGSDK